MKLFKIYIAKFQGLKTYYTYSSFDILDNDVYSYECNEPEYQLESFPHFKKFCYILTKNITNVCLKIHKLPGNKESCDDLNYWTYYYLINNNFNINNDDISQSEIITYIDKLWQYYFDTFKNCNFRKYNISVSDFNIMKQLYDYSKNYSFLQFNFNQNFGHNLKKCYCTYIKQIKNLYNKIGNECSKLTDKHYCTLYNELKEKEPNKLFSNLSCSSIGVHGYLVEGDPYLVNSSHLTSPIYKFTDIIDEFSQKNVSVKIVLPLSICFVESSMRINLMNQCEAKDD
ncbi:variable surface protein [Plasmodium gonderi]|uniref:Variable surface protein n=1 Tax=Plasmodium gonderi TaxID=77519 RepID=A0A1Y1JVX1_PLAGO|nr:variable surface protein [Plasmodium gonderi]GAW84034.1 variable surface protein [Plasmodium gonderi]